MENLQKMKVLEIRISPLTNHGGGGKIISINGIINNSHKSRLQFYHGAMNSSKSTKLLIKARELEVKGLKVF